LINRLVDLLGTLVRYDDSLLYSGDITGFVISIYTSVMGQFFGGLVLLTVFSLVYIRTNDLIYGAILWILVGGAFEGMIPTQGFSVAKLFIVLGIASGLFSLFSRGGRRTV
jgi:hypothetical protein